MNNTSTNNKIFITGGSGYIGSRLIPELLKNGFEISALARKSSGNKIPSGCTVISGDALNSSSYENEIRPCKTFIHLVGVPHPGPGKKEQFRSIDLVSVQQSVSAALKSDVKHFIYLSVAHPAPVMKDFIEVRMKGEELIRQSGMNATFIRPWYVLGPGHYWPYVFIPFYKLLEIIPSTRESALRLGLVKLDQIINCIVYVIKDHQAGIKIFDVKDIKNF